MAAATYKHGFGFHPTLCFVGTAPASHLTHNAGFWGHDPRSPGAPGPSAEPKPYHSATRDENTAPLP